MKKKIILAVVLLLCFIPTLVALISYRSTNNAPVDETNAVKISIDDIEGTNFTLEKKKEGDEADTLIRYFVNLRKNSTPIVALPDSLMGEKSFTVTLYTNAKKETYQCYFSTDPRANYFRSPEGQTYKITEEDAAAFITTEYAVSIYDDSTVPTLSLNTLGAVTPDNATWQYKNYTGEYVDVDVSQHIVNRIEKFELDGALRLTFDIVPDYCTVKIVNSDSGALLFDDTLDNLGFFAISASTNVSVDVIAKWYDDPTRSFCGTLEYKFDSFVMAPAEFYIGRTTLGAGEFTAVTALNVSKPENVKFTTSMTTPTAAKFYSVDENTAVALIPVDHSCPTGAYTLTFSYGSITQDVALTVENAGERVSDYTVPDSVINTCRTTAALDEFAALTKSLAQKSVGEIYFSGHFLQGVANNSTLLRGYGRTVYLNGSDKAAYINNGVDYSVGAESDVLAWNNGKVIYASSLTYPGNIVVIEHGLGLKTWYYNLGSFSVKEGDTVTRGQAIGKTGKTGFTGSNGAHIAMSIDETFVSPYSTWADSEVAGMVIIPKIAEKN